VAQIKITNATEFNHLLQALCRELVEAHNHFNLYRDLQGAISDYGEEMNQSRTFWYLTLESHLDASIVRLCKIYEHHNRKDTLNLRNLLDTIQANIAFFDTANFRERLKDNPFVESLSEDSRKPDEKQLQEDIAYVDRKNSLVQSLMMWRDNVVAHRNTHYVISQKNLGDDYPLTIENIEELLAKADEILNRYSILFSAGAYSMHIIGEDDYKFVLKSIRDHLDLQK
jgi:hypothetical protein